MFRLPPLKDKPSDPLAKSLKQLQVLQRAEKLHVTSQTALAAWRKGEETFSKAKTRIAGQDTAFTLFQGSKSSELNRFLRSSQARAVKVNSPQIEVDEPLQLTGPLQLDLGTAELRTDRAFPYLIRVEQAHDVSIKGGVLKGSGLAQAAWGVLIADSTSVLLRGMRIEGLAGGIIMTNASDSVVWSNELHGIKHAPILLHGASAGNVIAHNDVSGNEGFSNWEAAIVLSDRSYRDFARAPAAFLNERGFPGEQKITDRVKTPRYNVISSNQVYANKSSGMYVDGAIGNLVTQNRIEFNAKEGLCLDNGAAADVVAYNTIRGNGKRWGQTTLALEQDFVSGLGLLEDGNSPAKLPGLSIDNGAYNEIVENTVDQNYGGGIKMVRSGVYNVIGLNAVTENNMGVSSGFHFFGIELGSAMADAAALDLDFVPSRGNQVFGNNIRGSHYAGIFFGDGSDANDVFDNEIFDATNWAMESVKAQPNTSLNNLTNLKLRNISSGLDPALLTIGKGEFDASPPQPGR